MRSKLQKIGLVGIGVFAGILISLNFSANAGKETAATALPVEELRAFADVFNAIKQGYVEPVDDKTLINNAISGMLSNLDPHSAYLDADAFKDLQDTTKGEFGGLGLEVGMEDGFVSVISPIEDTPAWRGGVKAGDLIIKLDDVSVKSMSFSDAVKKMRGAPKTDITLTIARKGESKPVVLRLTREVIKVQSIKSKLIEPGYGYIRITQFQEETASDLVKALNRLYKDKENNGAPLRGLVLDLRNDPGGLLNAAIGVVAAFVPAGSLVVSTDGRMDDAKRKYTASPDDYLRGGKGDFIKQLPEGARNVPMVVVINGGSASASEIVAGALQDQKRALILGTQSFGKGSVQTVLPLSEKTGIKLTTARYYTPSGGSIQAKGITPDVLVEATPGGQSPELLREADLEHHLNNDKDQTSSKDTEKRSAKKSKPTKAEPDDDELDKPIAFASKDDYQMNQAVNLLKAWQIMQKK
jgi:carboxyl-terminal processing protease